ncbi:MAG: hypothetical protein M3464_09745 [Chloroflexota bacterium]|nr:hypothetical protein [Chloroflexota bacterium]
MAAIHETASGLHEIDALDMQTMRELDELCLTPVRPMAGVDVRAPRERISEADDKDESG